MGHNDPLLQILILLTASVCVVAAVRKLALPAILGYLAVGMLLGPHALALAADNETTQLLADFGVVFLVFTLGLEFSLPRLVAMRWEVLDWNTSAIDFYRNMGAVFLDEWKSACLIGEALESVAKDAGEK